MENTALLNNIESSI